MTSTTPTPPDDPAAPTPPATDTANETQPTEIRATRPRYWATPVAILSILIAIGASAGAYLAWRQMNNAQQAMTAQLEQTQARLNETQSQAQQLTSAVSAKLDDRLKSLQDQQQAFHATLQALRTEINQKTGVPQVLVEAESLTRLAHQYLLLEQDIPRAIAALDAAFQRVDETKDPNNDEIKFLLANDINALSNIKLADIPAMALTLQQLADHVEQIPLAAAMQELPKTLDKPSAGDWRNLLPKVWRELKSLVVVRYSDKPAAPLIAPKQSYFLYQNLRLQLESARLALLRHDGQNFRASLATARHWLQRYFNIQARETGALLDTLIRLEQADINPPLPEISGTLIVLHDKVKQSTSQPPAATDANPAPDGASPNQDEPIPPADGPMLPPDASQATPL
ncbi:MAG TPA: uroporphyrinogen-III C-methyltransferase [Gammaproteobacteria bacterium]|nr:uroporphyrinogen-III C-methyltransferase [Gammaproteobacteria bacterium]